MILILFFGIILWLVALSIIIFVLKNCQDNQEDLLYILRDDLNRLKFKEDKK